MDSFCIEHEIDSNIVTALIEVVRAQTVKVGRYNVQKLCAAMLDNSYRAGILHCLGKLDLVDSAVFDELKQLLMDEMKAINSKFRGKYN